MKRYYGHKNSDTSITVWYRHFLYVFFALTILIFLIWFLTVNGVFWGDSLVVTLAYVAFAIYFNVLWRKRIKNKRSE